MPATQEKESAKTGKDANNAAGSGPHSETIDPAAPAGSQDSLGEESIRDGRPATDDKVVEAIDEEDPASHGLPER